MTEPAARLPIEYAGPTRARHEPPLDVPGGARATVPVEAGRQIRQRALILWPRLDRTRLARTAGDPRRVARLVERRTSLPWDVIVAMLVAPDDGH